MSRNTRYSRRGGGSWLKRQLAQRPLPVWVLIVTDVLLIVISLLVFALFHHVLPRRENSTGIVSSRYETQAAEEADDSALPDLTQVDMDGAEEETTDGAASEEQLTGTAQSQPGAAVETAASAVVEQTAVEAEATEAAAPVGYFGDKFADKFSSGKVTRSSNSYRSANLNITVYQYEYDKSTFYFADIYIKDIECFRTGFANDKFGRSITELPAAIGKRAGSVLTINGDYYGARSDGVVIRNGELYRNKNITSDVCVLYWDGTMETYTRSQFNASKAMENGAYQAWHFGPKLLDDSGKPMKRFSDGSLGPRNPRTVLGYYEPGHYCFVVVDGRTAQSEGLTIKVLAQVMSKLGCKRAYNLDGGNSSFLVVGNKTMNNPSGGGRASSDAIMIVDR